MKLIDLTNIPSPKSSSKDTPKADKTLQREWDENVVPENGEESFYDVTGFPADRNIWNAFLTASYSYHKNIGLDSDYRYALYTRNILYPAQVLANYGQDVLTDDDADISTVIIAALTWQNVRDEPELSYNSDMFPSICLDIIHDLIDYYEQGRKYDNLPPEAQAIILSAQICDVAEAANVMDNWALKLKRNELTEDDVQDAKKLHQYVLMEKWIDRDQDPLHELLDRELQRLQSNLTDTRAIISKAEKKKTFKLVPGTKS